MCITKHPGIGDIRNDVLSHAQSRHLGIPWNREIDDADDNPAGNNPLWLYGMESNLSLFCVSKLTVKWHTWFGLLDGGSGWKREEDMN